MLVVCVYVTFVALLGRTTGVVGKEISEGVVLLNLEHECAQPTQYLVPNQALVYRARHVTDSHDGTDSVPPGTFGTKDLAFAISETGLVVGDHVAVVSAKVKIEGGAPQLLDYVNTTALLSFSLMSTAEKVDKLTVAVPPLCNDEQGLKGLHQLTHSLGYFNCSVRLTTYRQLLENYYGYGGQNRYVGVYLGRLGLSVVHAHERKDQAHDHEHETFFPHINSTKLGRDLGDLTRSVCNLGNESISEGHTLALGLSTLDTYLESQRKRFYLWCGDDATKAKVNRSTIASVVNDWWDASVQFGKPDAPAAKLGFPLNAPSHVVMDRLYEEAESMEMVDWEGVYGGVALAIAVSDSEMSVEVGEPDQSLLALMERRKADNVLDAWLLYRAPNENDHLTVSAVDDYFPIILLSLVLLIVLGWVYTACMCVLVTCSQSLLMLTAYLRLSGRRKDRH